MNEIESMTINEIEERIDDINEKMMTEPLMTAEWSALILERNTLRARQIYLQHPTNEGESIYNINVCRG